MVDRAREKRQTPCGREPVDETERIQKMARQLLRKAEAGRSILDSLSELLVFQDAEHRILRANRAAGESAGLSRWSDVVATRFGTSRAGLARVVRFGERFRPESGRRPRLLLRTVGSGATRFKMPAARFQSCLK
ncbi:MAG: hypothetical protein AB1497_07270 [Bacillota bacterium]